MVAGFLNLDKPQGWTSHDVVGRVRRLTGVGKVGHAGTLDPLATGVLVVCVGYAVRLSEYVQGHGKTYRATVRFGARTDTYDADGEVVQVRPVPALTEQEIAAAAAHFVGDIAQMPPIYSAIKQAGVPLHRRARRGQAVQVAARPVRIDRIDVVAWQPPEAVIEVACSAGTYIRSLAHDLGERIGCGAHLSALRRLASGPFVLSDACPWDGFEAAVQQGTWQALLIPPDAALAGFVRLAVSDEERAALALGRAVAGPDAAEGQAGYAASAGGDVLALLRYDAGRRQWQPTKVFTHELSR